MILRCFTDGQPLWLTLRCSLSLLIFVFCTVQVSIALSSSKYHDDTQRILNPPSDQSSSTAHDDSASSKHPNTLAAMITALETMQDHYFEMWQGIWPTTIDWTAAVMGTQVTAAISTMSTSFEYSATTSLLLNTASTAEEVSASEKAQENLINRYYSQVVASYFGQDAFALRNQAFDDMLWVVLGWLESVKLATLHNGLHYPGRRTNEPVEGEKLRLSSWYGTQLIPAFAHRARIFWDLAAQGWDTTLCGGGMVWSPYLQPYKNAITNELFVAASIAMYLYFPGDGNAAPFASATEARHPPHDPRYLAAAVDGYRWLYASNMTNARGLFVDGFHVSETRGGGGGGGSSNRTNTRCDLRDETVYTYNQGVILSGQRGLWEATGARSYLEDGHRLIADVVNATGWDRRRDRPYEEEQPPRRGEDAAARRHRSRSRSRPGRWHGLGRRGVLEEACDARGSCSQDAQTFKGIFFHHFTLFCQPLPAHFMGPSSSPSFSSSSSSSSSSVDADASDAALPELRTWHTGRCNGYVGWVEHNARAALGSRNREGLFGGWWGAGLRVHGGGRGGKRGAENQEHGEDGEEDDGDDDADDDDADGEWEKGLEPLPPNATDYRNRGVPDAWTWPGESRRPTAPAGWSSSAAERWRPRGGAQDVVDAAAADAADAAAAPATGGRGRQWAAGEGAAYGGRWRREEEKENDEDDEDEEEKRGWEDPNDRGRGRTVETQSGGVAVLRAMQELINLRNSL